MTGGTGQRDDPSEELLAILDDDERLRWYARPRWRVLRTLPWLVATILLLGFGLVYGLAAWFLWTEAWAIVFWATLVAGLALIAGFVLLLYRVTRYRGRHFEYAATDRRVVLYTAGIDDRDHAGAAWPDVTAVRDRRNALDRRHDTATIVVEIEDDADLDRIAFQAAPDPDGALATLQELHASAGE